MFRLRVCGSLLSVVMIAGAVLSGTVTPKSFQSAAVGQNITYYLYRPANYDQQVAAGKLFSVVYLMHWWAYKADGWSAATGGRINPQLDRCIDSVSGIICVAPQDPTPSGLSYPGTSWWVDSPANTAWKYSTFLSQDMVAETDATNATYKDRTKRGLSGASMGGYGALHNVRVHNDVFRVAYAIVPCTDLRLYTGANCKWGLCTVFTGDRTAYNPIENIADFKSKDIVLAFQSGDCSGTCPPGVIPDFFYNEVMAFDAALTQGGVAHTFNNLNKTGHEYPTPENMVAILRYFENAFGSVSVAPQSGTIKHVSNPVASKVQLVQVSKKRSLTQGSYVGLNGKTLKEVPSSGIVIKAK